MISLNDKQLAIVMDGARALPPEKRDTYLQRIANAYQRNGRRFNDGDLANAVQQALKGLIQQPAA
jgi:hypothetical protein